MGEVIQFSPRAASQRVTRDHTVQRSAEIIILPVVRIERWPGAGPQSVQETIAQHMPAARRLPPPGRDLHSSPRRE